MKVTPSGETVTEGFQHGTYSNKIPSPEGYSGGFKNVTPARLMLPDFYSSQLPVTQANPTLLQHSMMTKLPKQKATNEWADNIEKYWEDNPRPWGYAYGGTVDDDDIDDAVRIAKGGGGGFTKLVRSLLGPSEKEGLEALTEAGSGYKSVPGKPDTVKLPGIGEVEAKPLPSLESAAEGYMKRLGRPGEHTIDAFPPLDEDFARRVAGAYGEMKHAPTDPEVKRAYDALRVIKRLVNIGDAKSLACHPASSYQRQSGRCIR
jgi:hypothetical protein